MKIAIVGSRSLDVSELGIYIPKETTEIVSGGAKGIDHCAKLYALSHNIKLTEYLPDYEKYGRCAPLKRNLQIIQCADIVLAFWDGRSRGTKFVIDTCRKTKELFGASLFIPDNSTQTRLSKRVWHAWRDTPRRQ